MFGLVNLISSDSAAALAVQAAAETIRDLFLGSTAKTATRTVRTAMTMAFGTRSTKAEEAHKARGIDDLSPVAALGEALRKWNSEVGNARVSFDIRQGDMAHERDNVFHKKIT